jgi:hypothetical protein
MDTFDRVTLSFVLLSYAFAIIMGIISGANNRARVEALEQQVETPICKEKPE